MVNSHAAITVNALQAFVLASAVGRMVEMSAATFLNFLNQALVNTYEELKVLVPSVYSAKTTLSVSGYTVALPSDYKFGQTPELYTEENVEEEAGLYPSNLYDIKAGVLRFRSSMTDTFYLRYEKAESQYSASGNTVEETVDIQAKHRLVEEIKALYYETQADGESINASQNALIKSNRLS